MGDNFDRAVRFVLEWEGGYSNDPADAGGETKYGISRKAYPMLDIKNLTVDDALLIYRKDYWERAGCAALDWPMDVLVFDTAVNMGVGAAKRLLQGSDGFADYVINRVAFYVNLKGQVLEGWLKRVLELYSLFRNQPHPLSDDYMN